MTDALLNLDRPDDRLDDLDGPSQWLIDEYGRDLISLWPCDERAGASSFRDVVSGHDASISGTYALGQTSHVWGGDAAAEGDGSTAIAEPPDTDDFRFGSSQDFSVSVWLDDLQIDDAQDWFLGFYDGAGWILLHTDTGSDLELRWFIDDDSSRDEISGPTIPAGEPVHLVGVCDRSNDELRAYINGVREGTISGLSTGDISPGADPIRRFFESTATPYQESHTAVFSTALTDDDVAHIYERGRI